MPGGLECAAPCPVVSRPREPYLRAAFSMSRLRPKPGALAMEKPASRSPSRTWRATVKVLAVVPGPLRRAMAAKSSGDQRSGFLAGAKPSRNQASARGLPQW